MSDSFGLRTTLAAPPERVFRAFVEPGELETWLGELPGAERRLIDTVPERSVRFSWKLRHADTEVAITLEQADGGTELTLVQTGLPERQGAEPHMRDFWWLSLENLANHVEGRPLSPRYDASVPAHVEIDAPPERVFAALVERDQLERWIATKATVEQRVGGRYDLGWDHGPVEIVELVPDERLAYSWRWNDEETVVRWELEGSGGRTRLTVVHSGFGDPRDAEGYRLGWQAFLASLRRFVELGPAWRRPKDVKLVTR